jgi:hypothetical protein
LRGVSFSASSMRLTVDVRFWGGIANILNKILRLTGLVGG